MTVGGDATPTLTNVTTLEMGDADVHDPSVTHPGDAGSLAPL